MPLPLAAMVAGVSALPGIVENSLKVVDSIKSRFSRAGADAKDELASQLTQLRGNLAYVGGLAEAADAYIEALDEIRRLEIDALLVAEYLDHHGDALQNRMSPTFSTSWGSLQQMVATLGRDRDLPTRVHLARQSWFDARDDETLSSRLNDFNVAYARLDQRVQDNRFDGLGPDVEALRKPLNEVDVALRDTLTTKILGGLRQLRSADASGNGGGG